mgnify:CR=1 FL=1
MLYQFYETQRALLSPFSEFASATSKLYNHPLSPFAHGPMAQRVSAGFDLMHRLAKEYEKPAFEITSAEVDGVQVAVQEQVASQRQLERHLAILKTPALGFIFQLLVEISRDRLLPACQPGARQIVPFHRGRKHLAADVLQRRFQF